MLSIIIPTFNEAEALPQLLLLLQERAAGAEVIVSDGGSSDGTAGLAEAAGAVVVRSPLKGRAAQMNAGAAVAKGEHLYFLHADTIPPEGFVHHLQEALGKGAAAGCFRLRFDAPHPFLRLHAWFTRFAFTPFRFGDQSLFCTRPAFEAAGGFREDHIVLEDQEIIRRLQRQGPFVVLPQPVYTSARKYRAHGVYYTQSVFYLIYFMYVLGFSQARLAGMYRRLIPGEKT